MCYSRYSSESDAKMKAEAERQKEREAKRTEVVDKLRQEADEVARKATPSPTPVKETVPAK
ncbi:hypothetical protein [Microvirga puerhi]|uniref:Uncharacterized protein n=1 Tax=Microvirga puerhi TaxID=2876078 RepID=A0ABS7VLX0_9HYPH|nr:hypothetical protein [Microvirga puerhi]MBZ6075997.1 hypothetical protein [Microvirga puerhi]